MKIRISLIALFSILSLSVNSRASFEINHSGVRARSMGLAYVGLADSPDAIFVNCSGLAQIERPGLSLYYFHPFGLKEISSGAFTAILPSKVGHFGAGFTSYGNEIYNEQTVSISFARSVRKKVFLGLNFHYMKLQINGYGSNFSRAFDFGFLVKLTESFHWGFSATNLNRARVGSADEHLPQTLSSGFSLRPARDLIFNMDIFKDIDFPAEFRCGIEYRVFNRIALRSGITTQPENFCAGLGFTFSYFTVDYGMMSHTDLGITHQFGIQLNLK